MNFPKIAFLLPLAAAALAFPTHLSSQPYWSETMPEPGGYSPYSGSPYSNENYIPPAGAGYIDSGYAPKLLATVLIGSVAVVGIAYALTHTSSSSHSHSGSSSCGH